MSINFLLLTFDCFFGKWTKKSFRRIGKLKNKIPHFVVHDSSKDWTHSIFSSYFRFFLLLRFPSFLRVSFRYLMAIVVWYGWDRGQYGPTQDDNGRNTQRQEPAQKSRMTNCHYTYPACLPFGVALIHIVALFEVVKSVTIVVHTPIFVRIVIILVVEGSNGFWWWWWWWQMVVTMANNICWQKPFGVLLSSCFPATYHHGTMVFGKDISIAKEFIRRAGFRS